MSNLWRYLEHLKGLNGVPATWRRGIGHDFEAVKLALLTNTGTEAKTVPSPHVCGCRLKVVQHDDKTIVGVTRCGAAGCRDIALKSADIALWELNFQKLGRAIAHALNLQFEKEDLGLPGTFQVASFSGAGLPVILTIQPDSASFAVVVAQLVAMFKERFILLAPTNQFYTGKAQAMIKSAKVGFFDLESNLTLMAGGALHSRKSGGELFSALLPPPSDELSMDDARKLYALVLACHTEQVLREAPIKSVFDLYCKMGFSAQETSIKLKCSKATIINRLAMLRKRTGVSADRLRDYKPFFEQIESSLADPRARRIRRGDAIYGDDPGDEGEK